MTSVVLALWIDVTAEAPSPARVQEPAMKVVQFRRFTRALRNMQELPPAAAASSSKSACGCEGIA
eukprot:6196184-Pleurochrysis_carterae.AAC.1